jgi:putative MATE family efflux protein
MSGKKQYFSAIKSINYKSLWIELKQAIAGNDFDYTDIRLGKAIFLLAIPMMLEMIMESIFAIVDIYFVSKLGSDAVAAVGLTESIMTIVYAIGMGLGISTTALVSRRIGEKNPDLAAFTAVQAIVTGLIFSILIAIPGIIYAKEILAMMGAEASLIESGYTYPMIMLGGNGIIMLLFIINAVFRSSGDAALSLRVLVIANVLNMILDPCLIFGLRPFPEMGITGAAVATTIGRGIAVIYQFWILGNGNGRVKILMKHLRISWKLILKVVRISLGGIGQNIIAMASWVAMVRIIAEFGSTALAGYTIAIRVVIFTLLPSWGLANAASTLVGQNLGALKPDRAEKSVWTTGFFNMGLLSLFAVIFLLKAEYFISFFSVERDVIQAGVECLTYISYGYLFYGMGMVMIQAFNGAGDTTIPTWINVFCFWMLEIPLAWFLALKAGMGVKGVYLSIVIAESSLTIVAMILFRRGRWKKNVV